MSKEVVMTVKVITMTGTSVIATILRPRGANNSRHPLHVICYLAQIVPCAASAMQVVKNKWGIRGLREPSSETDVA